MADNFNMKQFLMENKLGAYSRLKEDNVEEVKRYQIGDMWSSDFDYKGMLKAGAALTPNADAKVMQAVSDSFEDVNYHRENSHLQDAIKAKKRGDIDAVKFHLALFKNELAKTIKSIKETQIFERKKVEEGEAAYEYEKFLMENKLGAYSKLRENNINEGRTAEELFQMFQDEDLVNDRREYDVEDLMSAYPGLSEKEAEKLFNMLQNIDENKKPLEKKPKEIHIDNEKISPEAIDRLEGLANVQDLAALKAKLRILASDWMQEGFEKEDVVEYLKYLVNEI